MSAQRYTYRGDKHTDAALKGALCTAIRNQLGKCIRGSNGNMLVVFDNGRIVNVLGRQLRKVTR
jgi:hypothetical protein